MVSLGVGLEERCYELITDVNRVFDKSDRRCSLEHADKQLVIIVTVLLSLTYLRGDFVTGDGRVGRLVRTACAS